MTRCQRWRETGVRGYSVRCQFYNYVVFIATCGWNRPEISTLLRFKTLLFLPLFYYFPLVLFQGHNSLFLIWISSLHGHIEKEDNLMKSYWLLRDGVAFRHIFTYLRISSGLSVLMNTQWSPWWILASFKKQESYWVSTITPSAIIKEIRYFTEGKIAKTRENPVWMSLPQTRMRKIIIHSILSILFSCSLSTSN